ncbi:MAG: hypothetical protein N2319_02100 [Candidatus Kapabacteria bacterium]|nr:hypothetical protein [Candidatus Kapabacteria bacterium]
MKTFLLVFFAIIILSSNNISYSKTFPIQDQGITSQTHRNNIGKIVWATKRIKFDSQDNVNFVSEFSQDESIYGRGYLPKCLYNLSIEEGDDCLNPNNEYELRLKVNGVDKGVLYTNYFPDQDWTTFQITPKLDANDSEDRINKGLPLKWASIVNNLDKGKHHITIEFWAGKPGCERKKYAEGSFVYNKITSKKVTAGESLPKSAMNNPSLVKEMIEAVKNQGWKNEYPIDVIILESDWRINKNPFGVILNREINTYVILKDNNGNCRANDISFRQPYKGKSYGKTEFYGFGLKSIPVDCSNYGKK